MDFLLQPRSNPKTVTLSLKVSACLFFFSQEIEQWSIKVVFNDMKKFINFLPTFSFSPIWIFNKIKKKIYFLYVHEIFIWLIQKFINRHGKSIRERVSFVVVATVRWLRNNFPVEKKRAMQIFLHFNWHKKNSFAQHQNADGWGE